MTERAVLIRAVSLTSVTMVAFAGNSVLCRMALKDGAIDPATFTSIRLLSGAVALYLISARGISLALVRKSKRDLA